MRVELSYNTLFPHKSHQTAFALPTRICWSSSQRLKGYVEAFIVMMGLMSAGHMAKLYSCC